MDMANFSVNLASIEKKFPKGMTVPPLLKALGPWIAKFPKGTLGDFEAMTGGKFDDGSLSSEANKAIAAATGIFMAFGEGSELALWNHGEGPPAVVLIDSEGQNRTVAPTFEAFLEAWSKQNTRTELDAKYLDDAPPQRHEELAAWLKTKKLKVEKRSAPDFAKWVKKLAKTDTRPKASGLPAPPKDMASRAIASLGKPATDKRLAALLAELGIDLKNYKTADSQRFLHVPKHGYSFSFEKKKLDSVKFTAAKFEDWDYVNGKDAKFAAFPHEIIKGVKITDKIAVIKRKLGKSSSEDAESGSGHWDLPGKVLLYVSCVHPEDRGPIPAKAVEYISAGVKRRREW